MTHSAGLEKGLNQAVLEGLENKIDEHLRDRLDDYSAMEPAKRIAKACDEMQAAMARVQQVYSRTDEGTTEQALAQLQSQMSVNKSVVYANMSTFVKTVEDKSHVFRLFNYERQNLGAHQFAIHSFFNHKSATAKDLIVEELYNARVSFGAYLSAEVKGHFVDNIEVFSLREAEVTALLEVGLLRRGRPHLAFSLYLHSRLQKAIPKTLLLVAATELHGSRIWPNGTSPLRIRLQLRVY
jgi:hypothetical protein